MASLPQLSQPESQFEATGSPGSGGYSYFLTGIDPHVWTHFARLNSVIGLTIRHGKGELKSVSLVIFGRKDKDKDGEKMSMTQVSGASYQQQREWKLDGDGSVVEM